MKRRKNLEFKFDLANSKLFKVVVENAKDDIDSDELLRVFDFILDNNIFDLESDITGLNDVCMRTTTEESLIG